jgi:hypothetical protein
MDDANSPEQDLERYIGALSLHSALLKAARLALVIVGTIFNKSVPGKGGLGATVPCLLKF